MLCERVWHCGIVDIAWRTYASFEFPDGNMVFVEPEAHAASDGSRVRFPGLFPLQGCILLDLKGAAIVKISR